MMDKLPSLARLTPPETGASMNEIPSCANRSKLALDLTGSEELMSTIVCLLFMALDKASSPSHNTRSTMLLSGSIKIITSHFFVKAIALVAISKCISLLSSSATSGFKSKPVTDKLAFSRLRIMGIPICPIPMNPI